MAPLSERTSEAVRPAARRARRRAPAAPLVAALLLLVPLAGCLFPPVVVPDDGAGDDDGTPIDRDAGPVYLPQEFHESETGAVSAGASVPTGGAHGTQPHIFDLPPRLAWIRIELEWEHLATDLDLAAELYRSTASERVVLWNATNQDGETGEPDSPSVLAVLEREPIFIDTVTSLRVDVDAKAGVDVPYTLSVHAQHLVPVA